MFAPVCAKLTWGNHFCFYLACPLALFDVNGFGGVLNAFPIPAHKAIFCPGSSSIFGLDFLSMSFPLSLVKIRKGEHRLFDQIYTFNVLTACLASSLFRLAEAEIRTKSRASYSCKQFDREVHFPLKNVIESIAFDLPALGIDIAVTRRAIEDSAPPTEMKALDAILPHLIGPVFTDFFENNRIWLDAKFGTDPYRWPSPLWNFGRVVRNAASHGGKINWLTNTAPPVSWHHLSYDASDRGKQLIGGDLDVGDVLILMLAMNSELDRLGCPT